MKVYRAKDWIRDPRFLFKINRVRHLEQHEAHQHEFFEFFLMVSGRCHHSIHGNERLISEGDFLLLSPGQSHSFRPAEAGGFEMLQVIFMPSILNIHPRYLSRSRRLLDLVYLRPFYKKGFEKIHLSGLTELKLKGLLAEMLEEYEKRQDGFEIAIQAKLMDFLISLVRFMERSSAGKALRSQPSPAAIAMSRILKHIHEQFKNPLRLEDMAEMAGVSREYFCVIFKKITGTSLVEYLNRLRIEEAKHLLSHSALPVTDVCFESGFKDLSYFSRLFRTETGLSPKAFRAQVAASAPFDDSKH